MTINMISKRIISAALMACLLVALQSIGKLNAEDKKDASIKSIVFDVKTPNVFYCPQEKQADFDKMIVKARPLDSLCQYGSKPKPKGATSDCYNDIDETKFACIEKKRFLVSLQPSTAMSRQSSSEVSH